MEINVQHSFESALLNPSLYNRCQTLKQLAENVSTKALHNIFPRLIQDIFGINRPGWGLTSLTSSRPTATEYQAVKTFLGVKGGIMTLLNKLQRDTSLPKFEMTVPTCSNMSGTGIEDHSWAYNQSYSGNTAPTSVKVQLSAYEFYFCHFAECITKEPASSQQNYLHHINFSGVMHRSSTTAINEDCLYFSLLNDYLHYFFPVDGSTPPMMPAPGHHSLQNSYQQYYSRADVIVRRYNQPYVCQNANFEVWCSEFLLHTFIDYWLNVQQISQKLSPSSKQTMAIENQIRALRQLIKHLHYFINSCNDTTLSHSNPEVTLGISQINGTITSTFYSHVFEFLSYCFDVWPLDASFRVALETWLSFIQPWRYTNIHDNANDQRLNENKNVANTWYGFISNNNDFYVTLFKKVINRFIRMDLSSVKNTYLMLRVARIFAQSNLLDLVDEADEALNCVERPSRPIHGSIGSYLHSSSRHMTGTSIITGMKTLFCEEFITIMQQLLNVCAQTVVNIKHNLSGTNSSSSWSTAVFKVVGLGPLMEANSSLPESSDNNVQDYNRTIQQLEQAIALFAKSFELQKPDIKQMTTDMSNSRKKSSQSLPDHVYNSKGEFELTEKGKYEVISQEKQAPLIPQRHPDLMPITYGENAILVRSFYKLCKRINTPQTLLYLKNICSRNDFVGKISSHLFVPQHNIRSPIKKKYEPRVSLRFWAHYRTLFYFCMWVLLSWLFATPAPKAVLYGMIFLVFYVFIDFMAAK